MQRRHACVNATVVISLIACPNNRCKWYYDWYRAHQRLATAGSYVWDHQPLSRSLGAGMQALGHASRPREAKHACMNIDRGSCFRIAQRLRTRAGLANNRRNANRASQLRRRSIRTLWARTQAAPSPSQANGVGGGDEWFVLTKVECVYFERLTFALSNREFNPFARVFNFCIPSFVRHTQTQETHGCACGCEVTGCG
jgi:hypothetical protein